MLLCLARKPGNEPAARRGSGPHSPSPAGSTTPRAALQVSAALRDSPIVHDVDEAATGTSEMTFVRCVLNLFTVVSAIFPHEPA